MAELSLHEDDTNTAAPGNIVGFPISANASSLLSSEDQLALAERRAPTATTTVAVQTPLAESVERRRSGCDYRAESTMIHPNSGHTAVLDRPGPVCLKESSNSAKNQAPATTHAHANISENGFPSCMPLPWQTLEVALEKRNMKHMHSANDEPDEFFETALRDAYLYPQKTLDELQESSKRETEEDPLVAQSGPSSAVTDDTGPPKRTERIDHQANDVCRVGHDGYSPPALDSKLEETCKLAMEDVSMVDSVTNNLIKVSIQPNVVSTRGNVHGKCGSVLENCKDGDLQSLNSCQLLIEARKVETLVKETFQHVEHLQSHNVGQLSPVARKRDTPGINSVMKETPDDRSENSEEESKDTNSSSSTSTLSFSSSSDDEELGCECPSNSLNQQFAIEPESELEDGELKESTLQRKKMHAKRNAMAESSDDERGIKGPPQSRSKIKDLPRVPKVSVILQPHQTMVPAGLVSAIVGVNLIIEGIEGQQPLSEGSILWLTAQRSPLGTIDELFGPVKKPFYIVRYNEASELPIEAKEGAQVSFVHEFADFVLNNSNLYSKGYDNGGEDNEELSDSEVYFSDDEKEAEYKHSKSRGKRGSLEPRTFDSSPRLPQERKTKGKQSSKDNRNQRLRADNNVVASMNNEFLGRPPRHQNSPAQHPQCERDLVFRRRQRDRELSSFQHRLGDRKPSYSCHGLKATQKCMDWQSDDLSPMKGALSQEPVCLGQPKPLTPPQNCVFMSDDNGVVMRKYQSQEAPRTYSQEAQPLQSNQSSQDPSWEPSSPQNYLPTNRAPDFLQGTPYTLQNCQAHGGNESGLQQHRAGLVCSPVQSMPQSEELNLQHCFMQPALVLQNHLPLTCNQGQMSNQSPMMPSPQSRQANQPGHSPHMSSQLSGVQHLQVPVYNTAMVGGQISQVVGNGYSVPTINDAHLQSVTDTGHGPIFHQQIPVQAQFTSLGANQLSVPANSHVSMQMAYKVQPTQVGGYPSGVQAIVDSAPVLGIPVGHAGLSPSSYAAHNQHYPVFNPGCPQYWNGPPLQHGVTDHPRPVQPGLLPPGFPAVPGQQRRLREDGFGQNPYHDRPHHGIGYESQRF